MNRWDYLVSILAVAGCILLATACNLIQPGLPPSLPGMARPAKTDLLTTAPAQPDTNQTFTLTVWFAQITNSPGTVTNILPLTAFVDFSTNGGVSWQRLSTTNYPVNGGDVSFQFTNQIDLAFLRAGFTILP